MAMAKKSAALCAMALALGLSAAAHASDPAACEKVRMAEPGWNDLTFTTGVGSVLLDALGYKSSSDLLAIPVIYQSLKNKDLDVFLGYWDPAMVTYAEPYEKDGSVERLGVNLEGAKYTFAVSAAAWEAGVKDFADLHKFADQFEKKMYGIEPGSNQLMLDVVADPALQLEGWEVVESSEQGMLAEAMKRAKSGKFVVFQGWAPHPMNVAIDMKYLTGGDKFYGPDFGAATVSTQVRQGYMQECPNVAKLLTNLKFNIDLENRGIGFLINDKMSPRDAALAAMKSAPEMLDAWLDGVTTLDGKPGREAVKTAIGL